MKVDIDVEELEALRAERTAYKKACQWLQERNTALVEHARRQSIQACVAKFHHAMGIPVLDTPRVPADERVRLRLRLIAEEFFEVLEACGIGFNVTKDAIFWEIDHRHDLGTLPVDLPELADALCDLDFVVEGTRLEFGITGGPVLAEVHRTNMLKAGGPKREDGKQMKPEGWKPPDIARVLREQGWLG
jgi:predicted HAD superfamily Cof-like phosphohydrolase